MDSKRGEKMAVKLSDLTPPRGARRKSKRLGRGTGSGQGKTAGRGQTGQRSRSGSAVRPEFEGGQMPLIRRLPKRGFTHLKRIRTCVVNLEALNRFSAGSVVDPKSLCDVGLISSRRVFLKILGQGELKKKLTVKAHQFSKSALEKLNSSGSTAEQLPQARQRVEDAQGAGQ
jgi:large subunit ribosomal protein L15